MTESSKAPYTQKNNSTSELPSHSQPPPPLPRRPASPPPKYPDQQYGHNSHNVQYVQMQPLVQLVTSADNPYQLHCPYCNHVVPTVMKKRRGLASWVAAGITFMIFWPLAWVPLVVDGLKDRVYKCSNCNKPLAVARPL